MGVNLRKYLPGRCRWSLIGEDYGGFDLAERDRPVFSQELFFFLVGNLSEAVFLIEFDRPGCVGPGADEDGFCCQGSKVLEELATDAFVPC